MTITEMRVHMDCPGCETKIKKALQKVDGIDDIDIDMAMQKVTVMGWADQKKVLKAVRKTGRRAELWPYPYNPEYYNFNQQYYYLQKQETQPAALTYYETQYSTSSYNYRKHGYSNEDYGYYQTPPYSIAVDEQASAMFSDENPHACSIM
ncbi:heavy metal-associated isoprenylated plant protein 28 isoform X2 [Jatropha curcas]|uniref:heavy metal-associated isoprenylated plant protein 28 isoform X2 n=1 Tax=Jatropha curcas TaxID=180498 RepID=UPI001894D4FA|nr:heavy metal-associated isoprenylated plant protein 28 isoform X2 [Jatropha curcas]